MPERVLEHVGDPGAALDRLDVPRERDQVAPVALLGEQLSRARGIALFERSAETLQPFVDLGGRW